jgi:hypothetical protein
MEGRTGWADMKNAESSLVLTSVTFVLHFHLTVCHLSKEMGFTRVKFY